jgi:hypothetical protein
MAKRVMKRPAAAGHKRSVRRDFASSAKVKKRPSSSCSSSSKMVMKRPAAASKKRPAAAPKKNKSKCQAFGLDRAFFDSDWLSATKETVQADPCPLAYMAARWFRECPYKVQLTVWQLQALVDQAQQNVNMVRGSGVEVYEDDLLKYMAFCLENVFCHIKIDWVTELRLIYAAVAQ